MTSSPEEPRLVEFKEVPYEEGERHVGYLTDTFYVSVLRRTTGFGHMKWETGIVSIRPDDDPAKYERGHWDYPMLRLVFGDHRKKLLGKTKSEILSWYEEHDDLARQQIYPEKAGLYREV